MQLPYTLSLAATILLLPTLAQAQAQDDTPQREQFAGFLDPEPPFHGYSPDNPMPPKVLLGLPGHNSPTIPVGPFRPGPNTPPAHSVDPDFEDAGNFTYFQRETVRPTGINTSTTGEPSVAQTDHVVLQTGNWYAARSTDNGSSWTNINPGNFFPSPDGGFCCDQKIIYVPTHDITVWVLQYSYSAATGQAGYRIAVANGDADLANPNASAWTSYYITPQNSFGFGTNVWFDFPDIAVSNDGFFLSANVYDAASSYQGSVIIRTTLADLQANGSIPLGFINSITHDVRFAPRMARGGSGDRIFWSCLRNTSTASIGYYTDAGTWDADDRSIASVSNGNGASTVSPDGVNWARRAPTRYRGAYGNSTEVGFLFTSNSTGAARPNQFIRVSRFTADNARTLISEHDIWSNTSALAYGAAATNAQGHVGVVAALGSNTAFVHSSATIIDNYQPSWGGLTFVSMGAGQNSPNQNRWGDYFDVREHDNYPDTFVATGMRQIGGTAGANNNPQYVWFGRDDYEPTWVTLDVQSSPVTGVAITMEETDMNGSSDGTTNFSRRFTPNQPYTLTAPSTYVSGETTYVFERWRYRVSPTGTFSNGTLGETELSLSSIGGLDDTAIADYVALINGECDPVGFSCGGDPTHVYETFSAGDFDLTQDVLFNFSGSTLRTDTVPGTPVIAPIAADLGLGDDQNTELISLGFTLNGLNADAISICSNGYIWLGRTGSADWTHSAAEFAGEGSRLAVYWTDLSPNLGGSIHVDSQPGLVRVTYDGVWPFGGSAPEATAQVDITATTIRIRYDRSGGAFAQGSLVGLGNDARPSAVPGPVDLNGAVGGGSLVGIPAQTSTYDGFSRGFNFIANTNFTITELDLPLDNQQAGDTASYLVRINGNAVLRSVGNAGAIATNIPVAVGNDVDIIGNWSSTPTNNFTAHNSYASGAPLITSIGGVTHSLNRTGWQWDIGDPSWLSGSYLSPTTGSIGRVLMSTSASGTGGTVADEPWGDFLHMTCLSPPVLGGAASFRTRGVPSGGLGLFTISLGPALSPGLSLSAITPVVGCEQYVSPGFSTFGGLILFSTTGTASLGIPNNPAFVSVDFAVQSWGLSSQIISSNAIACLVGEI